MDTIKETVYQHETYQGKDVGFAKILMGGVRVSTNVMDVDQRRAIGTTVSREVYDRVIKEGQDWTGRSFVVNDWYISSYTPIYDIDRIIGVLTPDPEAKYRDIKLQTTWLFLGIT